MLVYPYQYIATRQDESGNSGFFETIQNYFINFGGNSQSDENSQIMDAVEPDKQESIPSMQSTIVPDTVREKLIPSQNQNKQKFVYSYITPASTVPLNADRRLFYLAEQPQIFGAFSGSSVNPVFNLQPVPVVLSRSNVAQPDDPQPNKVISENAQKFSQIPPVMANVEQVPVVQAKSSIVEPSDSVIDTVPENRVAPTPAPEAVEDNRALPVLTEPSVEVKSASVVEARSAIPLIVSNEAVAPAVALPVVDGQVEGIESIQPVQPVEQGVVGASLKDALPEPLVAPIAPVAPVVPAASPAIVEQNVAGSETVEAVTGGV